MDSARFILHAFLALPSPRNYHAQLTNIQKPTTLAPLFSDHQGWEDGPSTKSALTTNAKNAIAAATILAATAIALPGPASAAKGVVIEGPSNAEMVELTLKLGEKVMTDTQTLLHMSDGVSLTTEYRGDTIHRFFQGGRLVADVFTNQNLQASGIVALAPQFPSRVLPVALEDYGTTIIGNVHSFLAAPYAVELDYVRASLEGPNLLASTLRMERATGKGTVYLTGSGNIFAKKLGKGENLKLYPGAWVAMTDNMKLGFVRGKTTFFSASSLLEVEGPGTIWIDTEPISRIGNEIDDRLPDQSAGSG